MLRFVIALSAAVLLTSLIPAQAELLVSISKSQQRAAVTVDGAEIYRWPVSTGVRGHDTPAGAFRPTRLERHWYSRQYSLTPMPWAVFFHRGYAVHGTMEATNLGRVASHGCVRLRPDNAAILYSLVRRQGMSNTKVVVMNGPLPMLPVAPGQPMPPPPSGAATSMVEAPSADDALEHFAEAPDAPREKFAAQSRSDAIVYRVSIGSDEGKILRERQAWLRSLDRKYGITH